jgi:hypothetical protein
MQIVVVLYSLTLNIPNQNLIELHTLSRKQISNIFIFYFMLIEYRSEPRTKKTKTTRLSSENKNPKLECLYVLNN